MLFYCYLLDYFISIYIGGNGLRLVVKMLNKEKNSKVKRVYLILCKLMFVLDSICFLNMFLLIILYLFVCKKKYVIYLI